MKRSFLLNASLLTLVVLYALFSCSKSPQVSEKILPDGLSGFSLPEIKRSFESDYAAVPQTRADGEFDESEILSPGWITPLWDSVSVYYDEHLFQAGVVFEARYGYRLLRRDDTGLPELFPMPSRLIVLKDSDTDETTSYLRFFIPDAGCGESDAGNGFSGLVLYTMLSGCPVSVGKFSGGVLSESASLWDDSRTIEENVDKIIGLLPDICVARVRPRSVTRGIDGNNLIEDVVIVGHGPINVFDDLISMGPAIPPIEPPFGGIDFGSGGGGGNGNSDSGGSSDASYPKNPKITMDKPSVRAVLDSLYNDCMGQLLINAIGKSVTITSGYFGGSSVRPVVYDLPTGPLITGYNVEIGFRCDPISVMEELMHIYQGVGTIDYQDAAMNNEVEAKLAWYMYLERTGSKISIGNALGGKNSRDYFNVMMEYFIRNDFENPAFVEAYENTVGALRTIKAYKNEDRYPFDPGKMNCEKLLELMKDCLK